MITDKERHERAKNFRDMISAREYGIPGKVGSFVEIDDLISELLDRRVYFSEVDIDACEALVIADLIDRQTCNDVADFDHESFKCSRCGYRVLSIDGSPDAAKLVAPEGGVIDFGYCPNCGAEVVDE